MQSGATPAEPVGEWETVRRRQVADLSPWLRVWSEEVRLPDGRVIEDFARIEMRDYTVVVAVTLEGDAVTLRAYKHGPRRVSTILPAGYLEDGEEPVVGAQRELLEETGYVADHWTPLGRFTVDGNRDCGQAHLFLAQEATFVRTPEAGDLEEMRTELVPFGQLVDATRRGDVELVGSAAAIGLAATVLGTE